MLRLGLLASHRGSGVRALVQACRSGAVDAEVALIISNNAKSAVLAFAEEAKIPSVRIGGPSFADDAARDAAMLAALQKHEVNLVVLLGYLKLLGAQTLKAYRGRILNIHPALLPRFGGQGMYGMAVHEAVLAAGERVSGATIHVVDAEYDHGPIVAQTQVPVEPGDDPQTLAARVGQREHSFLAETIQAIATGRIVLPQN